MKKSILVFSIMLISGFSFSQALTKEKEKKSGKTSLNNTSKSLSNSSSKPVSRIKHKEKIKQISRKENHEVSPNKD